MINTVAIAVLFFVSLFLQTTVVQAVSLPLAATPLHLAIGFLLLHRGRLELGAIWFLITPVVAIWTGFLPGAWWGYILIAVLGPILVTRIFAKRSLLALMGLSLSLYLIFMISSLSVLTQPTIEIGWGLLMLTITLIVISYAEKRLQRFSKRFLYVTRRQ